MAKHDKSYTATIPFSPKDAIITSSIFRTDFGKEFWVTINNGNLKFTYPEEYRGQDGELRIAVSNYRYPVPMRYNLNKDFIGTPVTFKPLIDVPIVTPFGISGMNFTRYDNLTHWIGTTSFALFNKFRLGINIDEFLQWADSEGIDILRTFLTCRLMFDLPPDSYDKQLIKAYSNYCHKFGLVNSFVIFADAHLIFNDTNKELDFCAQVREQFNPADAEELVNEVAIDVNSINTDVFPMNSSNLSSHGSTAGDTGPVIPYWTHAGFHEGRNDEHVRKIKTAWEYAKASKKPVVLDELMRPDQYNFNHDEAFQMGFMSGMFGPGCTIHSEALKRAEIPTGDELSCVLETLEGLSSVPPEVYNWNYGRFGPDAPGTPMPIVEGASLRTFVMMNDAQTECYLISIKDADGKIDLVNDWKIADDFGSQCYYLTR